MSNKKKASFVQGAVILAAASIIVKVIGAVFRIPLTNLVGSYAMGLYSTAYRYYSIFLTIATAGLPIAISKMISESRALKNYRESKRIFKIALMLCISVGLAGTLALIIFSGDLALATNDINASASIIALAPAVLFMSCVAAFRGYFQGHENMVPTALSQILEALSRLLIGLFIAWFFLSRGFADKYIAAGTISGISIGTVLTLLLMIIIAFVKRYDSKVREHSENNDISVRSDGTLFGALLSIAVPVTIGSLVMNLTSIIDMFLITNRLAAVGYDSTATTSLFGIYDNYALPIFNLVPSIIISLNVSVTPTISAAFATGNMKGLHDTLKKALRIVVIFTMPAAVGISILSGPILSILYKSAGDVLIAAPVLSVLGVASFFLCASSLTSTAMQALGHATIPLITMLLGAVVKIISSYILIAIPGIELCGAAIGTVLCYVVITVLNMAFLARFIGFKPPFVGTYVKPVISCVIMGIVVVGTYKLSSLWFGNLVSVAASILLGVVVYFAALIISGGVVREDIEGIPVLKKIAGKVFPKQ